MTEQLLGGSRSPLFGTDAERLRDALRAIDFVLEAGGGPDRRESVHLLRELVPALPIADAAAQPPAA
jgi:hypothetical protein